MSDVIITPEGRILWPSVYEMSSFQNNDPDFNIKILISKDNKSFLSALNDKIIEVAKANDISPAELKRNNYPIRDADEEFKDKPEFANCVFFGAKTRYPVEVVDVKRRPVTDLKSGDYGKIGFHLFGYKKPKKGVSIGLDAVLFIRSGDEIGGGKVNAAELFAEDMTEDETDIFKEDAWGDTDDTDTW